MSICNNCGLDQTQVDTVQGVSFCTSCGLVLEENIIVSSINFTDDGVKSSLTGKIIDLESTQVGTQYVDSSFYIKNTIKNICSNLGLGNHFIELSYRLYRLLLPYNLTKGKSLLYTLSAVIYCICRQEKTPHLLIDFSTSLNLDVFKIGRSFTKICEVLWLQIPQIDPSLYIQRFIIKLKLKNPKIGPMSLRIVSRMDRDWISTGRRPNNLCGAAILIASRIYNEERSINEISKVVHVAESTIKIRLEEIKNTKTSELSIEEFNLKWIEKEEEPPIIKKRSRVYGGSRVYKGEGSKLEGSKVEDTVKGKGEGGSNEVKDEEGSKNTPSLLEDDSNDDLLTEDESKIRTTIWNEMYEDF